MSQLRDAIIDAVSDGCIVSFGLNDLDFPNPTVRVIVEKENESVEDHCSRGQAQESEVDLLAIMVRRNCRWFATANRSAILPESQSLTPRGDT